MRGLKLKQGALAGVSTMSHLLQMRGLKLFDSFGTVADLVVASFTDAWIETVNSRKALISVESHLLQMRGLKLHAGMIDGSCKSRIFYRCVD